MLKTVCYDEELRLEAYRFAGIDQPFPNHFHDYYVLGLVDTGERKLTCRNRTYSIGPGTVLLFQPGDNHGCTQCGGTLDYRGLNIPAETMEALTEELTGNRKRLVFSQNVWTDDGLRTSLDSLHRLILSGGEGLAKEETLFSLFHILLERCGGAVLDAVPACRGEVAAACRFMESHYRERISLDQLCRYSGQSKSTLLRAFTREKGVTPYRYLQSVRIGAAKKLLEQGVSPVEAALQTGFSDQSHFTRFFQLFIGLSPAAYGRIFKEGEDIHGT